jgi:uncharacterized protein YaiI (UPF0178 family)
MKSTAWRVVSRKGIRPQLATDPRGLLGVNRKLRGACFRRYGRKLDCGFDQGRANLSRYLSRTLDILEPVPDLKSSVAIVVDADACPVKDEVYRVAERHSLPVYLVSNRFIHVPRAPDVHRVVVGAELDAADDWIAQRVGRGHIVVTSDIPLASRCVKTGALVLGPNGRAFSEDAIGLALATRNLMTDLRAAGMVTRGPKPLSGSDRSKFLSALHEAIVLLKRTG